MCTSVSIKGKDRKAASDNAAQKTPELSLSFECLDFRATIGIREQDPARL
jgi:hypothetical protein